MSMSSRSQAKLYVSRGVQTEDSLLLQLPRFDTHLRSSLDCQPGELATSIAGLSPGNMHSRILGALANEGAYTHSQISDDPEPLPLASSSCKNKRYTGLGFNRPFESYPASKRVVSLPDPSVQEAVITERNLRIVSMPEFSRFPPLDDPNSLQPSQATNSSFSSDVSHNSMESADQRWPLTHHKMHPMDIPQTPSPPSSPDSVVIIGHVPHLSGAFLRPACTDSDGWVTWATSPPRPIPALHGPLSLPYARCPSGAEGTVIEGDDLSHKIWGLGTGETPMNAHISKVGAQQQQQPVLTCSQINVTSQNARQLAFPHQRLGDDVIDLSMPSTFYPGLLGCSERYIPSSHCVQPYLPSDIGLRGENSIPESRVGDPGAKRYQTNNSPGLTDNSRIGSDLSAPMTHRGTSHSGGLLETRLNKAAPIFIPSAELNSKGAYIQQKENTTSALDHQYSRRAGLTQHRHIELLSPPSTSSPHWSPVFCQSVDIGLPKGPYGPSDPKIYSPRADLDDYSNKLMSMIQQIKQQDLVNSTKRFSVNSARQREPLAQKNSAVNDAGQWREEQLQSISGKVNASQPSSDFRRDLSQQHPRSIPLARLIQRRLSSVAEEDGSLSGHGIIPFMQTVHPRASLGPLIYRSHTDRLATAIPTEAFVPVSSSQPTNEAKDIQSGGSESNAIVRLPRRSPVSRVHRASNDLSNKRPLHDDTKKEKEIINAQEDKSKSEGTAEKGKYGQKKKSNSGKQAQM